MAGLTSIGSTSTPRCNVPSASASGRPLPQQLGGRRVREELPLTGDRELEQHRRDRGDHDRRDRADEPKRALVVAAEQPLELEEVRDRRDGRADHRRDRRHEHVAVSDVRQLVCDDAANLVARHQSE